MTDKRYVKITGPARESSDEDLRELGRRLFDKINEDRIDEQAGERADDHVDERADERTPDDH